VIDWFVDSYGNKPYQMISCGELTEQDTKNHENFYSLVNIENTDSALVCVKKQNDAFAVGSISFWRTGAEWYAKKVRGKWELITRAQDALLCSLANQLPEEFYRYEFCYPD
jgi:hypothetical protein